MSATGTLRRDHEYAMRLERVVDSCSRALYAGRDVDPDDVGAIASVIAEFFDSVHYSREEDSYFACVASYGTLRDEIRAFMIEHEFGRRIARSVSRHLARWRAGDASAREPVARFLRTYAVYLRDHVSKEEEFFGRAAGVLSPEEEREMYELFRSSMDVARRAEDVARDIARLESRPWAAAQAL